mmetsp:Transcript_26447/g.39115  ORF Transcript_26447/g.39115 Transcript_26447/m.39115 type:complete len:218 (+) Transcript_26447:87-740(+)
MAGNNKGSVFLLLLCSITTAVGFLHHLPSSSSLATTTLQYQQQRRSTIVSLSAKKGKDDDKDVDDSDSRWTEKDMDDRRHALKECATFKALDKKGIEKFVKKMETIFVQKGDFIDFSDGDMHLVAPGSAFDCVRRDDKKIQTSLNGSMLFGRLKITKNEQDQEDIYPNLLQVKAKSPVAKLWRFSMKDFTSVVPENIKEGFGDVMKKHPGEMMILSE